MCLLSLVFYANLFREFARVSARVPVPCVTSHSECICMCVRQAFKSQIRITDNITDRLLPTVRLKRGSRTRTGTISAAGDQSENKLGSQKREVVQQTKQKIGASVSYG